MADTIVKRGEKVEALLTAAGQQAGFELRVRSTSIEGTQVGEKVDIGQNLRLGANVVVFNIFSAEEEWEYEASILVKGERTASRSGSGRKPDCRSAQEIFHIEVQA